MLRQQAQMVVSAATQPVLLQVAQETQAKELVKQVQEMQERLLRDPEAAKALEELLKYFQAPPEEENHYNGGCRFRARHSARGDKHAFGVYPDRSNRDNGG